MKLHIKNLQGICIATALEKDMGLSERYGCNVYLKREDQQVVRSYKIRGAYNKISSLSEAELERGVLCASAGNHAQGVAYSCKLLGIHGTIFMPTNTPMQKVDKVKKWGDTCIDVFLHGETYDECCEAALRYNAGAGKIFIHPFDDLKVIEGQGTVGKEITDALQQIDYVLIPVGGGGLAAGVGYWFSKESPDTVLIGVEPEGAASMTAAFEESKPVTLNKLDTFVDGAAVRKVGELNYGICKQVIQHVHSLPEGKICATLLELYNEKAMVVEPAGAMTIAALDDFAHLIEGKNVVCIVSGSNNDVLRMGEIQKLADAYEGLHHHMVIRFSHKPDGLTELFTQILGEGNHVTRLQYERREHGRSTYALVSIRSRNKESYSALRSKLNFKHVEFKELSKEDFLFKFWV